MRIAYLMQAGVADLRQRPLSGPANHVKHVFDELGRLGHCVTLLVNLNQKLWMSSNLEDFRPVSVRWLERGPFRLFEKTVRRIQSELELPYAALFESLRFAQACRQELGDYDLLYERMGWMGYGGGLAARWLGIPLILEVNGDHMTEMEMLGNAPRGTQRWVSTWLMKHAIRRAHQFVATGEGWRQRFIDRWDVESSKINVIENGTEIVNLLKREQLRAFCERRNLAEAATIVYVGAFEPWHGITILLRAIAKAKAHGKLTKLVIIGTGSEFGRIKLLIGELELERCVTLIQHLDMHQLATYLTRADIGVSPYCGRVEYSGLKLLDYKAAGLATIASGVNGQPAVIEHGRTGWIVPPCDEDALCQAIIRLASSVELRQQIGQAARAEAEKYHTWRHTAEQLDAVFKQVISSS